MFEYKTEVAKGRAKILVETDEYATYRKFLDMVTEETDKRAGYTTASSVSKEENLLNQFLEEQHWEECRQIAHYDDELKQAKAYITELLKLMPYVKRCVLCSLYETENGECNERVNRLNCNCFNHYLQDEIEAFLKGEKKDECGNV